MRIIQASKFLEPNSKWMKSYLGYKNLLADAMLMRHINVITTRLVRKLPIKVCSGDGIKLE